MRLKPIILCVALAVALPLMAQKKAAPKAKPFTVVIDAGHGGQDPGAVGHIVQEKKLNLDVSLMLGRMNISAEGGDIICRNNIRTIVLDTYYHLDWDISSPTDAISTDWYDMACGKLCYQLNAGRKDGRQAWFQTISEDSYPVPDNRHLPVWYFDNAYYNESPDGIETIDNGQWRMDNPIFDLSGRRVVGTPARGIYIRDGKKIAIGLDRQRQRR